MAKSSAKNRLSLKKSPKKVPEKKEMSVPLWLQFNKSSVSDCKDENTKGNGDFSVGASPPKKRQKISTDSCDEQINNNQGKMSNFAHSDKDTKSVSELETGFNSGRYSFCPNCQMPLSDFGVQFLQLHIIDCLEVERGTLSECSEGRHCSSTIESHYKKFTHYELAAHHAGTSFTAVKSENSQLSNSQLQDNKNVCAISLSDFKMKISNTVSSENSTNDGNTDRNNVLKSPLKFEEECTFNNVDKNSLEASFHISHKLSTNFKDAASNICKQNKIIENSVVHSTGKTDINVQSKINNKLPTNNMLLNQPVMNNVSMPSSPKMKRQATITSFFKSPGKNNEGCTELTFVREHTLKREISKNRETCKEDQKLRRSASDTSVLVSKQKCFDSPNASRIKLGCFGKEGNYTSVPDLQKTQTPQRKKGGKNYMSFTRPQVEVLNQAGVKKRCPFYKKIPNTSFTVDAFSYGSIPGITHYFLSHFHADHYTGLTRHFQHSVYCSSVTANLVSLKLRLPSKFLHRLPMNKTCVIDGVEVTLLDANHCPGSVMFLFHLPNGQHILHTGDFRASLEMQQFPSLNSTIHKLYLDTTYCDPFYNFPPQQAVLKYATSLAVKKIQQNPKTLVVCGSYTIGKEKVFLAIAEALNCKVWAKADKQKVLNCLEDEHIHSRLVPNALQAQVHILSMNQVTLKFLHNYLPQLSDRFNEILGLKPTGWTHSSNLTTEDSLNSIKPSGKSPVTIYGVPYSEHSSFSELQRFVQFVRPRQIIPTVNNGSERSRSTMNAIFKEWLKT